MDEKQINAIVRALRSFPKREQNLKTLQIFARKSGRCFSETAVNQILTGLRDAERVKLQIGVVYE